MGRFRTCPYFKKKTAGFAELDEIDRREVEIQRVLTEIEKSVLTTTQENITKKLKQIFDDAESYEQIVDRIEEIEEQEVRSQAGAWERGLADAMWTGYMAGMYGIVREAEEQEKIRSQSGAWERGNKGAWERGDNVGAGLALPNTAIEAENFAESRKPSAISHQPSAIQFTDIDWEGVKPKEAIKFFDSKVSMLKSDFKTAKKNIQAMAFTAAHTSDTNIMDRVKGHLSKALEEGTTLREFRKSIEPIVSGEEGWNKAYIETVFRTNMMTAYNAGKYTALNSPAMEDFFPYLRYNAVNDGRTRPAHRALDGLIWKKDDPIWNRIWPPNGYNCRCSTSPVSEKYAELNPDRIKTPPENFEIPKKFFDEESFDANVGKEYFEEQKKYSKTSKAIETFAKENPEHFPRGYKYTVFTPTEQYTMRTDGAGTIKISSSTEKEMLYPVAETLQKALAKTAKGQELTFNEEHSLANLWHEILHNTAKMKISLEQGSLPAIMMETSTEYIARQTYPDFLKMIRSTTKIKHQSEIIEKGFAYRENVKNFGILLSVLNIDEMTAVNKLKPILLEKDWTEIDSEIAKALAEMTGGGVQEMDKIYRALNEIKKDEQEFKNIIEKIWGKSLT